MSIHSEIPTIVKLSTETADVHSLVNGITTTTTTAAGGTSVDARVAAINILVPKLKQITDGLEEEIGRHILAIKAAAPNNWEAIVKAKCGLSRSRSYELMSIADGTKSTEQTRRESSARQIKRRQKQVVRDVTDKKELAAAQAQIAQLQAAHARQVDRFKAEIARLQLGDAEMLRSERNRFRGALDSIGKLLGEARALTVHFAHNRVDIIAKINRAQTVANSALQPANAGLPVKRAA
jgi:hypothetical protein